MGMVNAVIPHDELENTAYQWAQEILEKSPTSIKMLKFAMNLTDDGMVGQQVFAGEATSALYADVAEMYLPDADYSAGTVVCIGGSEEVTACSTSAIPAGIVSTDPAYLMNAGLEDGVAVGLIGRLPVRVVGAVTKGQVVKVDSAGVASATGSGERVGIALEASDVTGEKLIECMLKT